MWRERISLRTKIQIGFGRTAETSNPWRLAWAREAISALERYSASYLHVVLSGCCERVHFKFLREYISCLHKKSFNETFLDSIVIDQYSQFDIYPARICIIFITMNTRGMSDLDWKEQNRTHGNMTEVPDDMLFREPCISTHSHYCGNNQPAVDNALDERGVCIYP